MSGTRINPEHLAILLVKFTDIPTDVVLARVCKAFQTVVNRTLNISETIWFSEKTKYITKKIDGDFISLEHAFGRDGRILRINRKLNNMYHGMCKGWTYSGFIFFEYNYAYDKKHGICRHWYYDNQQIRKIKDYYQGQKHGLVTKYRRSGYRKYTLSYQYGQLHGPCIFWDLDGQVREIEYAAGVMLSQKITCLKK